MCVVEIGVSLCAMCSETDAAVRWSVHLPKMKYFQLKYQCRDRNSGKIYQEVRAYIAAIQDTTIAISLILAIKNEGPCN